MSVTINNIVLQFGLPMNLPVKWGTNCPSRKAGVYIIALPIIHTVFPVECNIIKYWCINTKVKTFRDRTVLSPLLLETELGKYWHLNETIVYVGKAKCLRKRIYQFYGTPLGKRGPHSGGYWIQTLQNLNSFDIYWFEHENPGQLERDILEFFSKNVACVNSICIPYANVEIDKKRRKVHKIRRPYIP